MILKIQADPAPKQGRGKKEWVFKATYMTIDATKKKVVNGQRLIVTSEKCFKKTDIAGAKERFFLNALRSNKIVLQASNLPRVWHERRQMLFNCVCVNALGNPWLQPQEDVMMVKIKTKDITDDDLINLGKAFANDYIKSEQKLYSTNKTYNGECEPLLKEPDIALEVFISALFHRGRRNSVSQAYYEIFFTALGNTLRETKLDIESFLKILENERWIKRLDPKKQHKKADTVKLLEELKAEFGHSAFGTFVMKLKEELEGYRKKPEKEDFNLNWLDLQMFYEALLFVKKCPKYNLYCYLKENIEKNDGLQTVYNELDNIKGVGQKLASLVIRDAVIKFGLYDQIKEKLSSSKEACKAVFPIDTWVRQYFEMKNNNEKIKDSDIFKKVFEMAKGGKNILLLNAGIWNFGQHFGWEEEASCPVESFEKVVKLFREKHSQTRT